MNRRMRRLRAGLLGITATISSFAARAQDANAILAQAVHTELEQDRVDRSRWRYRDDEQDKKAVSTVVQTDAGSVKRATARAGVPLSPAEAAAEQARLEAFIHDDAALAKQRKDGDADDKQASELLAMMPRAFTWRLISASGDAWRLAFVPNPAFHPSSMESRVMGQMGGEMVVDKRQHRIITLSGRLTEDVTIGFGLLGRLKQGGVFRVERREVKPGFWQITETHVHIDGKALLFKTIGQQQDEVQTDWTQVPNGTTLQQAVELSKTLK